MLVVVILSHYDCLSNIVVQFSMRINSHQLDESHSVFVCMFGDT